jgi:hypothetical protein
VKIKLLVDLPVAKEHRMTEGRILEVLRKDNPRYTKRGAPVWWVRGKGKEVGVLERGAIEVGGKGSDGYRKL